MILRHDAVNSYRDDWNMGNEERPQLSLSILQ